MTNFLILTQIKSKLAYNFLNLPYLKLMFFVIELNVLLFVGVSLNVSPYLPIHASEVKILSEHI